MKRSLRPNLRGQSPLLKTRLVPEQAHPPLSSPLRGGQTNEAKAKLKPTVQDADAEQAHARAGLNKHIARRQKLLLAGIGSLALIAGSWFLFSGDGDDKATDESGIVTIDTGGLVNRNLSQREFVAAYENRLNKLAQDQKELKEAQLPTDKIEEQIEALRLENSAMRANGQAAIDAISAENAELKAQLEDESCIEPPPSIRANLWSG